MEKLLNYLGYPADDLRYQIEAEEAKIAEAKAQLKNLRCLNVFVNMYNKLKDKKLFLKLAQVEGCKPYHTEGNALVHTFLVFKEMYELYPFSDILLTTAMLHDVGKIFTGRPKDGDPHNWEYPNHSGVGAQYLSKFIDEDALEFKTIQWLILNHIRPLFWLKKGVIDTTPAPENDAWCSIENLATLALCDIRGSISTEPQQELEDFLKTIAFSNDDAKSTYGRRTVIGMKNGKFLVDVHCQWCNNSRIVEVPVKEYIDFIVYNKSCHSLSESDNFLLSELWCGCPPV